MMPAAAAGQQQCAAAAGPFLKWVGGKGKLVGELVARVPPGAALRRHIEPFLGGGALFFARDPREAVLSDLNTDLVATYVAIRDELESVIAFLERLAAAHGPEAYCRARADFNRRDHGDAAARAALFIYLNKTGFNGLYRVNGRGEFNVPMGRYTNPAIVNAGRLRAASRRLQGVELRAAPFETLVATARPGDFVYLDPPYEPASRTANFTSYVAGGFSRQDHVRLASVFRELDRRGAKLMLSSSDVPCIRALYRGYAIDEVLAPRAVSCRVASRGTVRELIVRNYSSSSPSSSGSG